MFDIDSDQYYQNLVQDIMSNEEFNKIKEIEHHGTTRYAHSLRVSYYSYRLARLLRLDYRDVARAGLLHDFFLSDCERTKKDRIVSTFVHPKYAVMNSQRYFKLNDREVDIIKSHMFPIYTSIPKYAESWVVSIIDKAVGTYEFGAKFKYKFSYTFNIALFFLIRYIK